MTHEEASNYITAPFLYCGLTNSEAAAVVVDKYMSVVDGVTLLGTMEEQPALAHRRLVPQEE